VGFVVARFALSISGNRDVRPRATEVTESGLSGTFSFVVGMLSFLLGALYYIRGDGRVEFGSRGGEGPYVHGPERTP
jgi:hypothetical protein